MTEQLEQLTDGVAIGINRIALVAMYRLWMALPNDERTELFEEVCEENDVEQTMALVIALVESVGFAVEAPPAQPEPAPEYPTGAYL